jgi:tetratricopeptide (TPR) repeat protein/tRNA A-37 threonylcarbamoyl transferase component Bud32
MPTEELPLMTVDENARRRFEAAWQEGRPEPIERFLPAEDHPTYPATLEELIHIELEWWWKTWSQSALPSRAAIAQPPLVETYLTRFSRLNQPAIILRLLQQEYRVRHRYGDRPAPSEYHTRFPELVITGHEVEASLAESAGTGVEQGEVPGYQILGFLGRGGMGVVYKARQTKLNRLVALKMILGGSYAGEQELARFRNEAEAVARLQHPNIVQIHEVGEQNGLPYFSLELVDGGTLAQQLASTPQPSRAAAQLVETLAWAVHAAHQRGIIHRDLKPANVLLTKDGIPKITDFGLAKLIGQEVGQTQTGAVVGTPSYMAPEQAAGRTKEISLLVDVYALGAILYEMLTGRPPFQGESTFDTLGQVRFQEPVPPRRLHPKVPRDLETICLKCLQKEPRKRYASAAELADDLRRFLAGEPILARPASLWERGTKWAKRRPAVAALLGVSGVAVLTVLIVVSVMNARLKQQRDYAVANFQKARDAMEVLTNVAQEQLGEMPQMETVRRDLLEKALEFYQDFARQASNDPEVRYETGRAYLRLGEIHRWLEEIVKAEQCFRDAVDLNEKLTAEHPAVPKYRQELGRGYISLSNVLSDSGSHPEEAEEYLQRALALAEKLAADYPDEASYQVDLGRIYNILGIRWDEKKKPQEAGKAYRKSLDILDQLVARYPDNLSHQRKQAVVRNSWAVYLEDSDRLEKAEQVYRQNVAFYSDLVSRFPTVSDDRSKLALTLQNLSGILEKTGRTIAAEQLVRQEDGLRKKLTEDFPNVPFVHFRRACVLRHLAALLAKRGEHVEARALQEQAVRCLQTAHKLAPRDPAYLKHLRENYVALAEAWLQLREHAGAAKTVTEFAPLFSEGWQERLQAGRVLARCAVLAEKDDKLAPEQRKDLAKTYADRAVQLLREAIQKGYQDLDYLKMDPALDGLRSREDFKQLLHELAQKLGTEPK